MLCLDAFSAGDSFLEHPALVVERAQRGVRVRRRGRTLARARHEHGAGQRAVAALAARRVAALAVPVVVEQRVLGQDLTVLLVRRHRALPRPRERLEDGDPAVLVEVGLGRRQRLDEELREAGLVALAVAPGCRDDDAVAPRQGAEERAAGAGRVHERHGLRAEPVEQLPKLGGREVAARQVELRLARSGGSVPDQHDEDRGPLDGRERRARPMPLRYPPASNGR